MVRQQTASKPSRSDDVLDADEQQRISNLIRSQFDSMAPKRPSKPNRSESDSSPTDPVWDSNIPLPELHKFRSLQSQSQAIIFSDPNTAVQDEFVETQYYKELGSVDKQHHTTGSGFINVTSEGGYDLLQLGQSGQETYGGMVLRTNPATNDWIPDVKADHQVLYVSSKPGRSESD